MFRSLYTGISGLRTNQFRMDVIGNNIANANTTGFKSNRTSFTEILNQRMRGAAATVGGIGLNSGYANVGNGVSLGSIASNWQQGSFEYTNVGTDLTLAGDGFFVVNDGQRNVLTRAGAFSFNGDGQLVTAQNLPVQGWLADANGQITPGALSDLRLDYDATSAPVETATVNLNGNLSADAEVGDDPVKVSTVIYDAQGAEYTMVLTFEPTATDEWTLTNAELAGDPPTALTGAGGTVTFNPDGTLNAGGSVALTGTFPGSADTLDVTVDLSGVSQFGGSNTVLARDQDGRAAGTVVDYGIDAEGVIRISYSNGEERALGQIAIASVNNPDGLSTLGDSFYAPTALSGDVVLGRARQEMDTFVVAGALEMSNVDLATEFTNMIVTQRGYQASARVITTSDELLQELVQLKR